MDQPRHNITVVGAGVAGLTTAFLLSKDPSKSITVVAELHPGDSSPRYASIWAGANYLPHVSRPQYLAVEGSMLITSLEFPHPVVFWHHTAIFNRKKDADGTINLAFTELQKEQPWFKDTLPNFRPLHQSELRGYDHGSAFTSVCINPAIYLPWLISRCLAARVVFRRAVLTHIVDAAALHHSGRPATVVVNCTGLGAAQLGGVMDPAVIPARAQIVLVRNESALMATNSGTDDGDDEICYVMQRAAGGGTILGGCYQLHNFNTAIDPPLATRIMQRAVALCPELTAGRGIEHLDVIHHAVGLRPVRTTGVRIEKERFVVVGGGGEVWVVHHYGHGGFGFQASYGCAAAAVRLVDGVLAREGGEGQEGREGQEGGEGGD